MWDRALRFPYPNGSKLRELVVLDAPSGLRKWEGVTNEADLWKMYRAEPNLLYGTRTCAPDHPLVTGVNPASKFLEDLRG